MIWLGAKRGYLSDWITQRWVQLTGKRVDLEREFWLQGPVGKTTGIGLHFFDKFAAESGLIVQRQVDDSGLIKDFTLLAASDFIPSAISPKVIDFYERTSNYDLDAWGEWCGLFRPFGRLLALMFSRVKVVFPLPNGNAIVIMRPEAHEDGSFSVTSSGEGYGDAGFYFTVRDRENHFWVRYVRTLKESIRVYEAESNNVRADHVLKIWGATFLRLHYRLRPYANNVSTMYQG